MHSWQPVSRAERRLSPHYESPSPRHLGAISEGFLLSSCPRAAAVQRAEAVIPASTSEPRLATKRLNSSQVRIHNIRAKAFWHSMPQLVYSWAASSLKTLGRTRRLSPDDKRVSQICSCAPCGWRLSSLSPLWVDEPPVLIRHLRKGPLRQVGFGRFTKISLLHLKRLSQGSVKPQYLKTYPKIQIFSLVECRVKAAGLGTSQGS